MRKVSKRGFNIREQWLMQLTVVKGIMRSLGYIIKLNSRQMNLIRKGKSSKPIWKWYNGVFNIITKARRIGELSTLFTMLHY
jgi:hypothetical protein